MALFSEAEWTEVLGVLRDERAPDEIKVPWRVVRYGRRLVDVDQVAAPPFFNVYADSVTRLLAAVEGVVARVSGQMSARRFWTTLVACAPKGGGADMRARLGFSAKDAMELFVALVVSGLPFDERDERSVLDRMEEVLRPVFPDSANVLVEDLTDPTAVSREVLGELDRCCFDQGIASDYLTRTTAHVASYALGRVVAALQAAARS